MASESMDSTVDTAADETGVADTMTDDSALPLSPAAEALGRQVVTCLHGDADPALVEQVLALIEADPGATDVDMECVANVLTTFDDSTLEQIIDAAATEQEGSVDAAASTTPDASDPAMEDALTLLMCAPDLMTNATESMEVADTAAADTLAVVTESTTG